MCLFENGGNRGQFLQLAYEYLLTNPPTSVESDFENGGNRGQFLQLAYEYLLTNPPTSVESEKAFSVAGSFVTKVRSSLGNESINAVVALKFYFNQPRPRANSD
ncbi:hAT family C-terminal dimerization region [Popillia japonica]|uniref:HAT family C-terminal dimerization region n=1 Tax=Popillia japonica TaxID=7064 RepID=A0AAW1M213_POPJA